MTVKPYIPVLFLLFFVNASLLKAQSSLVQQTPAQSGDLQLFGAPEESAQPVGSFKRGEVLSPMAETLSAGGTKWYLVRTESGSVGWIKAGGGEESKKMENFFNSLPKETSTGSSVPLPEAPSGALPRGTIVVPVEMAGAQVIVPVMLNRSLRAYLVLDTGATNTVVSRRIATNLTLRKVAQATASTVGGPITSPVAWLRSLKVGEAEVQNLPVFIHDFSPHPRVEGLLGLDFLGQFHVSLDSRKRVLVLSPR